MEKKINLFFKKIINDLKEYQFQSFLIAIISLNEKNNEIEKPIKRLLGKKLSDYLKKEVDFKNPDILIQINLKEKTVGYQIKSLYIYGRYQKIKAGIPQTKWKKKIYETSVEEEIGKILLKITKGTDHSFHGCGREDIDVLNIGNGRPFVIEIKNPKIRDFDINQAQQEINKNSTFVKVSNLQLTTKEMIKKIKLASPDKIYEATVMLERPTTKKELLKAEKFFTNIIISQNTPTRILRRKKDKTRFKKIYYFKLIKYHPKTPTFEIKSQSGTYIKELISGDNQRTKPSLSQLLNQNCFVKKLIVKKIEY
ncbi:MAG: tRNA pseudouridine(54/55) synthase Pus10 [Microgenomates group bacterium]